MWLADTSVKRPVFATMVIMALVVLGIVSYPSIGVDLFPKIDFPIVTITTTLKGASPDVMDVDVTDRIEGAVNTINGVKSITSTSYESMSRTTIEFVLERNIDQAVQDVREKVSGIRNKLPADIDEPRIAKVDPDASPILFLNLSGNRSVRDLVHCMPMKCSKNNCSASTASATSFSTGCVCGRCASGWMPLKCRPIRYLPAMWSWP